MKQLEKCFSSFFQRIANPLIDVMIRSPDRFQVILGIQLAEHIKEAANELLHIHARHLAEAGIVDVRNVMRDLIAGAKDAQAEFR